MSNNPRPISELEEKIGYVFKNKKLIETYQFLLFLFNHTNILNKITH